MCALAPDIGSPPLQYCHTVQMSIATFKPCTRLPREGFYWRLRFGSYPAYRCAPCLVLRVGYYRTIRDTGQRCQIMGMSDARLRKLYLYAILYKPSGFLNGIIPIGQPSHSQYRGVSGCGSSIGLFQVVPCVPCYFSPPPHSMGRGWVTP